VLESTNRALPPPGGKQHQRLFALIILGKLNGYGRLPMVADDYHSLRHSLTLGESSLLAHLIRKTWLLAIES
jgi:hypothetical protein